MTPAGAGTPAATGDAGPPLRIGQLAARSGRSVHAIRWYDAQGLIPGVLRDGAGRRVFNTRHVEWLALLERLRSTGMAIADLRRYAALVRQGRASLPQQHALLQAHRGRVAAAIDDWQAALALIDAKVDFYGRWIASGVRPDDERLSRRPAARRRVPAAKR